MRSERLSQKSGDFKSFIDFTVELEEELRGRFGQEWFDSIGNCMVTVAHPCWRFHEVPQDYKTAEDPERLPEARGNGRSLDEFHAEVDELGKKDEFVLVRMYASMFEKAWMTRGMERLMADLVLNPAVAERLFDKIVHMDLAVMDLMLENPRLDGFLLGSDWGGQDKLLVSPDIWRRIFKPRYARLF